MKMKEFSIAEGMSAVAFIKARAEDIDKLRPDWTLFSYTREHAHGRDPVYLMYRFQPLYMYVVWFFLVGWLNMISKGEEK